MSTSYENPGMRGDFELHLSVMHPSWDFTMNSKVTEFASSWIEACFEGWCRGIEFQKAVCNGNTVDCNHALAFTILRNGKRVTIYNRELADKIREIWPDSIVIELCPMPPEGWICTREYRHKGPCALWPNTPDNEPPKGGGQ